MTEIASLNLKVQRMQSINLSGGVTNAVEFCTNMFGFPDLVHLLDQYEKETQVQVSH